MDNIKTWTGLSVEESIRMTEDRDKWRKYVQGGQPSDRGLKNRTEHKILCVVKGAKIKCVIQIKLYQLV